MIKLLRVLRIPNGPLSIRQYYCYCLELSLLFAFADPLVDAVENFSDATSIPAFFISFIVLPLATSSRDAVSAITFASRAKRAAASFTFSEVCFLFPTLLVYAMFIV